MLTSYHAGCKINLRLKIIGQLADGYHLIDSIFWPLSEPYDELEFELRPDQGNLTMDCDLAELSCTDNTLTRAYGAFIEAGGCCGGVHVTLRKGILHGAGLGGGSSDAACVLSWCNANAVEPLADDVLEGVALRVGADVPFFLKNIPARVCGIGEHIEPIKNFIKDKWVLLVCPPIHISTKWAYGAWDERQKNIFSSQDLTKYAHKDKHTFSCTSKSMFDFENDFEDVVFLHYPLLGEIKRTLLSAKAEAAVMSGSGSTMVGIFDKYDQAEQASKMYKDYRVYITTL